MPECRGDLRGRQGLVFQEFKDSFFGFIEYMGLVLGPIMGLVLGLYIRHLGMDRQLDKKVRPTVVS